MAKKKAAASKGNGFSQTFDKLPVEMKLEIFSQLRAVDLFSLQRTSQDFRKLVESPAMDGAWRDALVRLGIPENKAGGMSIRQQLYLFLRPYCESCDRIQHLADFSMRHRLCRKCRGTELIRIDRKNDLTEYDFHRDAPLCTVQSVYVPQRLTDIKPSRWARKDDLEAINDELFRLEALKKGDEWESTFALVPKSASDSSKPLEAFIARRKAWIAMVHEDNKALRAFMAARHSNFEREYAIKADELLWKKGKVGTLNWGG